MIDEKIIPFLSDALGAGYEKVIADINSGISAGSKRKKGRKISGGKRSRSRSKSRRRRMRGGSVESEWIQHVRLTAGQMGCGWPQAMQAASKTYRRY